MFVRLKQKLGCLGSITNRWTCSMFEKWCSSSFAFRKMVFDASLPYVNKAKICSRSGNLFQFCENECVCEWFSAVCLQLSQKNSLETHFGLTDIESNMHCFCARAISFLLFVLQHPVFLQKGTESWYQIWFCYLWECAQA